MKNARKNKMLHIMTLCLAVGLISACSSKKPAGTTPQPSPSVNPSGEVIAEYTITFTYCDGGAPIRIKDKDGASINLPAGKSLDGKTFAGWSTEYDEDLGYGKLSKVISGKTFKINGKNQTLYAAYYEKGTTPTVQPTTPAPTDPLPSDPSITPVDPEAQITVRFYLDFNKKNLNEIYHSQVVTFGDKVDVPPTPDTSNPPMPEFPTFLGWSKREIVDDPAYLWNFDVDTVKTNAKTFDIFGIWVSTGK